MIEAILYVANFPALVEHLDENWPDLLERDESGNIAQPPTVTGFARTPATSRDGFQSLAIYARLRPHEVDQWRGMPGVKILAEHEYVGDETPDLVYAQLFENPPALKLYDSVYDRSPRKVTGAEGDEQTIQPPDRFGALA